MSSNWQPIEPGIMLWEPSCEEVTLAKEPPVTNALKYERIQGTPSCTTSANVFQHFGSHQHVTVLPTLDTVQDAFPVKQHIEQALFPSRLSSPETIAAAGDDGSSFMSSSTPENLFFEQLQAFAALAVSDSSSGRSIRSSIPSSPSTSLSSDVEYDSDRTDFLPTPCPKSRSARPLQTSRKSRYFQDPRATNTRSLKYKRVNRKLDFDCNKTQIVNKALPKITKKPTYLEYIPKHPWKSIEREFLCVINRWYTRSPYEFTRIFNEVFGISLPMTRVRDQFENFISLFGPKAFYEYSKVLAVPFEAFEYQYKELHTIIESTAQKLGIHLQRSTADAIVQTHRGAKARSPRTRNTYRSLVRRAKQDAKAAKSRSTASRIPVSGSVAVEPSIVESPVTESPTVPMANLGGVSLKISIAFEHEEVIVAAEPVIPDIGHRPKRPSLAFRVWDGNSATLYKNGFISNLLAPMLDPTIDPEPPNTRMFEVLATSHLDPKGRGGSAFVSVLSSFVQLLMYATNKAPNHRKGPEASGNPEIAIIDLAAPVLNGLHKQHRAKDILKSLKAKGELRWTDYRGECETLIWGGIDKSAIVHTLRLSDLKDLCEDTPCVADLLHLELFKGITSTSAVCERLQQEMITLNDTAATAMGLVAKTLGLSGENIREELIFDFVTAIFDGWYIHAGDSYNLIFMTVMAAAFARSLDSLSLGSERVMQMFIDGVNKGCENSARYTRRKRPAARRTY